MIWKMIFTTHDVNLIDLETFSQEEIWFVEKTFSGETRIKPFSDFEVKEGQDVLKVGLERRI